VARTLNLFRDGAVGFIDRLDGLAMSHPMIYDARRIQFRSRGWLATTLLHVFTHPIGELIALQNNVAGVRVVFASIKRLVHCDQTVAAHRPRAGNGGSWGAAGERIRMISAKRKVTPNLGLPFADQRPLKCARITDAGEAEN
jgi:hypothetical protein